MDLLYRVCPLYFKMVLITNKQTNKQAHNYNELHLFSRQCSGSLVLRGNTLLKLFPAQGTGCWYNAWYNGQGAGPKLNLSVLLSETIM